MAQGVDSEDERCAIDCDHLHPKKPDDRLNNSLTKGADTVGEPPSVEICLSNMPSLKAKKRGKRAPEKVLLEL